jgi:hypothetical protein
MQYIDVIDIPSGCVYACVWGGQKYVTLTLTISLWEDYTEIVFFSFL